MGERTTGAPIVEHYQGATIMNRTAYLLSIGYDAEGHPRTVSAQFDQGEWWRQRDGSYVRIADMAPGHRYNSAAMLMRSAGACGFRYAWVVAAEAEAHDGGDMAHDALQWFAADIWVQVTTDPAGWLRGTALYRALTKGLIVHGDGTQSWQKTGHDPITGDETRGIDKAGEA